MVFKKRISVCMALLAHRSKTRRQKKAKLALLPKPPEIQRQEIDDASLVQEQPNRDRHSVEYSSPDGPEDSGTDLTGPQDDHPGLLSDPFGSPELFDSPFSERESLYEKTVSVKKLARPPRFNRPMCLPPMKTPPAVHAGKAPGDGIKKTESGKRKWQDGKVLSLYHEGRNNGKISTNLPGYTEKGFQMHLWKPTSSKTDQKHLQNRCIKTEGLIGSGR